MYSELKPKTAACNLNEGGGAPSAVFPALRGQTLSLSLPDVHVADIGKRNNGATADEAVRQVLGALTTSVTRSVANINFGGVADTIKGGAGTATDKIKGLFK